MIHLTGGVINLWRGEYQVTRLVELLSVSARPATGSLELHLIVCNVGVCVGYETAEKRRARRERMKIKMAASLLLALSKAEKVSESDGGGR